MQRDGGKIRLGLLVDSLDVQAWVLRCIERIVESGHTEIVLVVQSGEDSQIPKKPLHRRLIENRKQLAWHGHCRVEKFFSKTASDAFELKNAAKLLADVAKLTVSPRRTKFSDYIDQPDLEKISAHDIDVFVRFGFRILRGGILTLAAGGVWSFHHGDNTQYRGGPAGVWEVFEKNPVTGAILQQLSEELDAGLVLDRIFCATDCTSIRRSQNGLFWAALSMLPRALQRMHELGPEKFFTQARQRNQVEDTGEAKISCEPGNLQTIKFCIGQAGRIARQKIRNLLSRQQWAIMYRLAAPGCDKTSDFSHVDLKNFQLLLPPGDKFQADPFVIQRDGLYHVFLEEFDRRAGRGHIAWMTIDQAGQCSKPQPIIKQPYHMSYPFVFDHAGQLYMIPETYENRTVEVYRCTEFPKRWELCKTLLKNIVAFDTTLLNHSGKWWLFANIVENEGASFNDELFLFSADDPLSDDWQRHPGSPIVSDVRRARPAGRIFEHDGKLYRPAQDCSRDYGYAVRLHEILTINDTEYAEAEVAALQPGCPRRVKCVHTFNHAGALTVVDVRLDRLKFF